jgi:quaternary ammonium compound-resistance protein SugE
LSWFALVFAGTLEPVWAHALALASSRPRGSRTGPVLLFLAASTVSLACLMFAMRDLPAGSAYAIWVGIGSALTVAWSMVRGAEKVSLSRLLCLGGIITCVAWLKVLG